MYNARQMRASVNARCALVFAAASFAASGGVSIRLNGGFVGDRLDACIANHVRRVDAERFARVFLRHGGSDDWQSEFWGKWMLSAVPLWKYSGDAALKARIDGSLRVVLAAQEPDGYIGNYASGVRAGQGLRGWDVWGMKYTMLGLIAAYEATGDKAALAAAGRLGDYLIARFGGGRGELRRSGNFRGLPSCSSLGAFVRLHRLTGEVRYLDFAAEIVRQLDAEGGARLLSDALAGLPVAGKPNGGDPLDSPLKAYEMMSCCQGLIEYAAATGDKRCFDAAQAVAASIRDTEINIVGGGASSEVWFSGAARETEPFGSLQETCVVTTWMRLCQMILERTGDSRWADEIERTFYNSFLASMRPDGSEFSQYCALSGTRSPGNSHSRLHTNCCDVNGPRGFLPVLDRLATASGRSVTFDFYATAEVECDIPATGRRASFETFTLYPVRNGFPPYWNGTQIRYMTDDPASFAMRLRVPAWSEATRVTLNGKALEGVRPGTYFEIDREWACGDCVEIAFDMSVKPHVKNGHVAFTAGPLVLARDSRFHDGDIGAVVRRAGLDAARFVQVRPPTSAFAAVFAAALPVGPNEDNPIASLPAVVRFADFASAGNTWDETSCYRVWLPLDKTACR